MRLPSSSGRVWVLAVMSAGIMAAQANGVPDMLERVLPSVVTVAVNQATEIKAVFGAVGRSAADAAYARVLDLSGAKGSGSGFVIERNGKKYVVTNAHVIENALGPNAVVTYSIDRTRYQMRIAGADSLYDLALLEFAGPQPGKEIRTIEFRTDEPRIGESVFAIGNPLGRYPYSVTNGIVSGKNRVFYDLTGKFGYLQSSATTIWGNSGGPLVDERGRVLGINSRIEVSERQQTFVHPQLNFALQSTLASRIISKLLTNKGRLPRAYLGIEMRQDIRPQGNGSVDDERPTITAVVPSGPAQRALAGKTGFPVERINGSPVYVLEDALAAFEKVDPGDTVSLELGSPSGETQTVQIKAGVLDEHNLSAISSYVFKNDVTLQGSARDGAIVLQSVPAVSDMHSARSALKLVRLRKEPNGEQPPITAQAPELELVAIGLIGEEGALLYHVNDMSTAGAAMKLVAMSGRIDLLCVPKVGMEPVVAKFRFSADTSIVRRTLIY
jgi:S1-C subfamily serine protease